MIEYFFQYTELNIRKILNKEPTYPLAFQIFITFSVLEKHILCWINIVIQVGFNTGFIAK